MRIFRLATALIVASSFAHLPAAMAGNVYYIETSSRFLSPLDGDPAQVQAQTWVWRFYRQDAPARGNDYWGVVEGSGYRDVLTIFDGAQSLERQWLAWSGRPIGEATFLNAAGPIAVMEKQLSPKEAADLARYQEKLPAVLIAIGVARAALDDAMNNPSDGYRDVVAPLVDLYHDSFARLKALRDRVRGGEKFKRDEIVQAMEAIATGCRSITATLRSSPPPASRPMVNIPDGSWSQFTDLSPTISIRFARPKESNAILFFQMYNKGGSPVKARVELDVLTDMGDSETMAMSIDLAAGGTSSGRDRLNAVGIKAVRLAGPQ